MLRSPLPDLAGFKEALTHHDVARERLVFDEKGTICAPTAKTTTSSSSAPPLPILTGHGADSEILMKGTLSEGGMGQVLLAEQTSIGREVAVKIAGRPKPGKPQSADQAATAGASLIAEARVAGQLEHPNIVPVHVLGTSTDGRPLIVMKRIEGESWHTLLKRTTRREDPLTLARDVEILMDVCRALHFAHARGVVHRDVKPANVMVGRFGEVYLLDWGVAVGIGDDAPPELPHARDVRAVAGTPHYMAPEMALPTGGIDARTDVYLAGAVLYEVLSGRPPHVAGDVQEALYLAHTAAPPVFDDDDDIPEELAAICARAMRRDPAERYGSADELREALAGFLHHAAARALCAEAEQQLRKLEALIENAASADADVQRAFSEARFGFRHALRVWPESARAQQGASRAVHVMARREVRAGHYDAAQLLLAELGPRDVDGALRAELDELRAAREREQRNVVELQRFAHEQDRSVAERERALFVFGSAIGWLMLQLTLAVLAARDVFHAASGSFALFMAAFAAVIAGSALLLPGLRSTVASRMLLSTMFGCVLSLAALHGIGWWYGIAAPPMLALGHVVLALTGAVLSTQDRRLWPATVVLALIAPTIVLWPAQVYLVSGVGAFAALTSIARTWWLQSRPLSSSSS